MQYTIKDFRKRFPNDEACLDELMRSRYGNQAICRDCHKNTIFHRVKSRKCYECQWCGFQVYPTADTIFHKSVTPLTDWFYIMYLMTATRSGVSAKEVERQLGVTYKTAWRMCHQIRKAMGEKPKLTGTVEVDETYVGGKKRGGKRGRGSENKTTVFGMVQRKGKVKAKVTALKRNNLFPIITETIVPGTQVMSDEFRTYRNLPRLGYNHGAVKHWKKEFVRGEVHTNSIESFWSQLKRGISGTHVWVSRQHLQRYVDEFAFRYNQRGQVTPMFDRLFQNLVRLS